MLKQFLFPVFIFLLFATQSIGQSQKSPAGTSLPANKKDVLEVKGRTLLVGLLGDPTTDHNITKVVTMIWDFNSDIVFVQQEEIPVKIKGKESDFAILSANHIEIKQAATIGGYSTEYIRFSIKLAEKFNKAKPVYYQDVFFTIEGDRLNLGRREIIAAIYNIKNHFDHKAADMGIFEVGIQGAGKLEKKTLLIDKEFIDDKFSEVEIKTYYPYPFKISTKEAIEKALLSKDSRYAHVQILPVGSSTNMMIQYVYDCEDGQMLSMGEVHNGAFDKYSNLINKEHLEAYVKNYERINKFAEKRKN